MRPGRKPILWSLLVALACTLVCRTAAAQSYGVELGNSLMPASGGMGGTSVARPQDMLSGINANPATLTQYRGTTFTMAGTFVGSTFDLTQTGPAPAIGVTPFSAKSSTGGTVVPNIGVSQELDVFGLPVTLGLGLIGTAGAGSSFVRQPASNGTSTYLLILEFAPSIAAQLTERLSIGATMFVGDGYLDGPFVGTSAMTNAFALRAGLGASYKLTENTTLGCYWKTKQQFNFADAVVLFDQTVVRDVPLGLPEEFGLGIANSSLLQGRLLLAADALFLRWSSADLFRDIYRDQWVMQLGAQFSVRPRLRLRAGYALAQSPIDPSVGTSVAGVAVPGGVPAAKYLQAQFAVTNQHRLSIGMGVRDVLPGFDFDILAGGMFPAFAQLGDFTSVSLNSYWIGAGITWRFGRGRVASN